MCKGGWAQAFLFSYYWPRPWPNSCWDQKMMRAVLGPKLLFKHAQVKRPALYYDPSNLRWVKVYIWKSKVSKTVLQGSAIWVIINDCNAYPSKDNCISCFKTQTGLLCNIKRGNNTSPPFTPCWARYTYVMLGAVLPSCALQRLASCKVGASVLHGSVSMFLANSPLLNKHLAFLLRPRLC